MTVKEVLDLENSISKMIESIKTDIVSEMKVQVNPDYEPINPLCGVVKLSALQRNDNWSPDYYIPKVQARLVESALSHIKTATVLQKKLLELIEKKSVIYQYNSYKLNPITIEVLKKYSTSCGINND